MKSIRSKFVIIYMAGLSSIALADQCPKSGSTVILSSVADLENISQCVNIYKQSESGVTYELESDISLRNINFTPIGDGNTYFRGTFNGNNHSISDLYLESGRSAPVPYEYSFYWGLFGALGPNSIVRDLQLNNFNFVIRESDICGGALASYTENAKVSNVSANIKIDTMAYQQYIAGLIGCSMFTNIEHSSAAVQINGTGGIFSSGGLIGQLYSSKVKNSNSSGNISASSLDETGGFIGSSYTNDTDEISINNSYSNTNISGIGHHNGGFIGSFDGEGIITNSYATGYIKSSGGGFVGSVGSGTKINPLTISNIYATGKVQNGSGLSEYYSGTYSSCSNSYWDTQTTEESTSLICSTGGRTTQQMNIESTFTGWDFVNTWIIDSTHNHYPYLRTNP